MTIKVLTMKEDILGANDAKAKANQERLDNLRILTINVMSSPGAGKTSLITNTIRKMPSAARIAVIEGDVASSIDAERVQQLGVPVVQINTAGGCHLDARMMAEAMDNLPMEKIDLLFIENVGNLICPAEFALGEHKRVIILSIPEGDDKPYKYPLMFTEADVILVNKSDLQPYTDFNVDAFHKAVKGINPKAQIFHISCKTGDGFDDWLKWLRAEMKAKKGKS
ncbi:MAG: hydrogenase nickel incorporation protein HypB [Dehalococcoidales bacterium]|nr:hydrogenase nickel incorporation protein HypB [Dehalococcoidales bacterium]